MTSPPRNLLFDLLRVLSAQMIFFHHLSLYGPFAEAWHQVNTVLASWLAHYGRYAVQVFLVLAGALAAQSMDLTNPQSPSLAFLTKRVFNRYLRLLKPYSFILLVTLGLTALARPWIAGDMLPIEQTWAKHFEAVLLHLSFLQSLSGIESLSTGVWYMAIDLQLFALFCLGDFLLARFGPTQIQAKTSIWLAAVLAGIAFSAWLFNTHNHWDHWAVYFFAAYGLGALANLARQSHKHQLVWWFAISLVLASLAWHWRLALAIAGLSSLLVWAWHQQPSLSALTSQSWLGTVANASYSFFLLNFALIILANLSWLWLGVKSSSTMIVWALALLAWTGCLAAAHITHRSLET